MENTITFSEMRAKSAVSGRFATDTTFVLFFLAMDIGSSLSSFGLDSLLSMLTLGLFIVLPYFLPFDSEKPEFLGWILGRSGIAAVAMVSGLGLASSSGILLPETVKYGPFTLLLISGILCAFTQMRAMMKVRLAN